MRLKTYEVQVLAGALLAALMEALILIHPSWFNVSAAELLEGGSFLLCCAGNITGGRAIRASFAALGSDKEVAARDATYMRARARFRIVSFIAVAAIAVLAARRFNINVAYALAGTALLGIAIPVIDRASGWVPDRTNVR
jgi:hypothetical protein